MKLAALTLTFIAFVPSLSFGNADGLSAEAIRDKVVENNPLGLTTLGRSLHL